MISCISRDTYKNILIFIPEIKKRLKNPKYDNRSCIGLYCENCPFHSSNLNLDGSGCADRASGMGPHCDMSVKEIRSKFEDFVKNFGLVEVDW